MHLNTVSPIAIVSIALCSLISCSGNGDHTQETSTTESTVAKAPNVIGREVTYEADSITMKGYLAYDANVEGKRPGVIVVHEWWGHNEHTRNAADKLAEEGYVAFALDMYGDGKTAEHPEDAGAFAGAVMQNFDGAKARFNAALQVLLDDAHSHSEQVAAIGYCFGGGVVLNMARQGADLDAVATFHGSIGPIEPAQPGVVNARLLVMNGEDDPFVSAEAITNFKAEMDSAGVAYEFVNYPVAVHAFTNPAATEKGKEFGLPLAYNKEADEKSWAKLLAFLDEVF